MRLPDFEPLESARGEGGVVTRADVVAQARTYVGVPYRHQHRDRVVGVDCIGLVIAVCRDLGLVAPDFDVNGYPPKPDGSTLLARCAEYMDPVASEYARPGDVLVLKYRRDPQHMGILADYLHGGFSLVHAYGSVDGKGQVEEWHLQVKRIAFEPLAVFALRGVQ